jgi:hypothetical protein
MYGSTLRNNRSDSYVLRSEHKAWAGAAKVKETALQKSDGSSEENILPVQHPTYAIKKTTDVAITTSPPNNNGYRGVRNLRNETAGIPFSHPDDRV